MRPLALLTLAGFALGACQEAPLPSAPTADQAPIPPAARGRPGEPIPGQYVVVFRRDVPVARAAAAAVAVRYGAKVRSTYEAALKGMAVEMSESAAAALRRDPAVEYVEQNQVVSIAADPIVQPGATAGLDRLDQRFLPLSGTYRYASDGTGVRVYILDSGLNFGHSEFTGRAVLGLDASWFTTPDGVDCNGHGTHVAGTVGGTTYGVAKKVQLVIVRILDCQGRGNIFTILDGIEWVRRNHVRPAVANMSVGTGFSTSVNQAVNNLIAAGVTVVAAAGNSGADACNASPSSVFGAITVAASDQGDRLASFSNHGGCVDLMAPGVGITSAWIGSANATATMNGTSMAAPHAAGAAALRLSTSPTAHPHLVEQELMGSATPDIVSSVPATTRNLLLYTGDPNLNVWLTRAPLPSARRELALGVVNGVIYTIGGVAATGTIPGVAAYNAGTNTWTPRARMPAARQSANGAALLGGRLYVAGGYDASNVLTRTLYAYNPSSNTWLARANMPVAGGCGASHAINGQLYVFTGCTGANGAQAGLLHRYDPATNRWTARKSAPRAHRYPASGVIGGKIYVVGGNSGASVATNTLDVYDPATNQWTTRAGMPTARRGGAAGVVIGGMLYVIGGRDAAGHYIRTVEAYSPSTNTWVTRPGLPAARSGFGAVASNGMIVAVGGRDSDELLATHVAYRP